MNILIKGMEMPISCEKCPLCYDYLYCSIDDSLRMFLYKRHPNCPLVEIDLVRCGECKYMRKYALRSDEPTGIWCHRWSVPRLVTDDGFCSYGERRADEHV